MRGTQLEFIFKWCTMKVPKISSVSRSVFYAYVPTRFISASILKQIVSSEIVFAKSSKEREENDNSASYKSQNENESFPPKINEMVELRPLCFTFYSWLDFHCRTIFHFRSLHSWPINAGIRYCYIIIIVHLIFKNLSWKFSGLQSNLMKHLKKLH